MKKKVKKIEHLPIIVIITKQYNRGPIQLRYILTVKISDYLTQALNRTWEFPSFSAECPICGGANCCVRIGYYYRFFLSIELGLFCKIPIARYLCHRKNKPKLPDRTFSLLPDCLIPYVWPTISTLMQVINNKLIHHQAAKTILDEVYSKIYDSKLNLSSDSLSDYLEIFEQTAQKIKTFLREHEKIHDSWRRLHSQKDICMFLLQFNHTHYGSGPESCARWYHDSLGGFRSNAYFLFGTAYQFRR